MLLASRYKVLSPLGKGGMGMVYKAHDVELDEIVAIKVLRPEAATSPGLTKRFRSEIKLARRVSHPNVCRIHEFGKEGPLSYIVMEYVDGVDFKRILRERGRLPPSEAYTVALQIADALHAIHTEGIIHRDLKTPNVMRNTRGIVKLMDFGIAKSFESGATGATATGDVVGTPEYMSPEQAQGGRVDGRSDVYALGIVTFELFTADVPFRSDTPLATLLKQIHDAPPLDERSELPRAVLPVLRKALAKAPQERFQNAREFGEALRRAEGQSSVDVTVASPATPRQAAVAPLLIEETVPMTTPVPTAIPTVIPPSTGTSLSRPSTGTPAPPAPPPAVSRPRALPSQTPTPAYPRAVRVGAAAALGLFVLGAVLWMRGARPVEPPAASPPIDRAGPLVSAVAAPEPSLAATLEAPVPLAPLDKAELLYGDPPRTVTSVAWRPVSGAAVYHLLLDRGPGFSNPLVDRREVHDTTLPLSSLAAGKYYWRVAAVGKDGHEGSFSPTTAFTIARAGPATRPPAAPAVAGNPGPSPTSTPALPAAPPRATTASLPVSGSPAATLPSPGLRDAGVGPQEGAVQTGTLQLLVVPWAEVEVDGSKVGISPPLKPLSLPAGAHAIKLSHPDYLPFRRKVTIHSGETTKLQVDLTKEAFPK
ncbi:MAG TPA: protein kinase [Vicinamibacteria bacterium]|nr:protein kinase [Vicinamibacteria bacterium]